MSELKQILDRLEAIEDKIDAIVAGTGGIFEEPTPPANTDGFVQNRVGMWRRNPDSPLWDAALWDKRNAADITHIDLTQFNKGINVSISDNPGEDHNYGRHSYSLLLVDGNKQWNVYCKQQGAIIRMVTVRGRVVKSGVSVGDGFGYDPGELRAKDMRNGKVLVVVTSVRKNAGTVFSTL